MSRFVENSSGRVRHAASSVNGVHAGIGPLLSRASHQRSGLSLPETEHLPAPRPHQGAPRPDPGRMNG